MAPLENVLGTRDFFQLSDVKMIQCPPPIPLLSKLPSPALLLPITRHLYRFPFLRSLDKSNSL